MDKQVLVHHIVAITGGLAALICGYGIINLGMFLTLTECSTIPLNRRNMMTKTENKSKLGMCNNIAFLINFTVFRMINIPYCAYKLGETIDLQWDSNLNSFRKFCFIYTAV